MKAGALILSFLFVVLSIQPAFKNWSCISSASASPKTCSGIKKIAACKKSTAASNNLPVKSPVKEEQKKNPCNTCNPFMACNGCAYVSEQPQELVSPSILLEAEIEGELNNNILQGYHFDSWHPPELFFHL